MLDLLGEAGHFGHVPFVGVSKKRPLLLGHVCWQRNSLRLGNHHGSSDSGGGLLGTFQKMVNLVFELVDHGLIKIGILNGLDQLKCNLTIHANSGDFGLNCCQNTGCKLVCCLASLPFCGASNWLRPQFLCICQQLSTWLMIRLGMRTTGWSPAWATLGDMNVECTTSSQCKRAGGVFPHWCCQYKYVAGQKCSHNQCVSPQSPAM